MNSLKAETKCVTCGGVSEPVILPAFAELGFPEKVIPSETCSRCREAEALKAEAKKQHELFLQRLEASGIPKRFYSASFDSYRPSKETRLSFRQISSHDPTQDSLFVYGSTGTGKTHLSISILMQWLRHSSGRFIPVPDLIFEIKRSFFNGGYFQFTDKMQQIPLLVLDDIGAERLTVDEEKTAFVRETLYALINSRYLNHRSTIFTSNFDRADLEKKLGKPIISRIMEMSKIVKLDGEDFRLKVRKNKGIVDKE